MNKYLALYRSNCPRSRSHSERNLTLIEREVKSVRHNVLTGRCCSENRSFLSEVKSRGTNARWAPAAYSISRTGF
jgi:hypothetical protein